MIMAGYQFFHVEAYGREESTKQKTQTKKIVMAHLQIKM